jgi:hypothetical protein
MSSLETTARSARFALSLFPRTLSFVKLCRLEMFLRSDRSDILDSSFPKIIRKFGLKFSFSELFPLLTSDCEIACYLIAVNIRIYLIMHRIMNFLICSLAKAHKHLLRDPLVLLLFFPIRVDDKFQISFSDVYHLRLFENIVLCLVFCVVIKHQMVLNLFLLLSIPKPFIRAICVNSFVS